MPPPASREASELGRLTSIVRRPARHWRVDARSRPRPASELDARAGPTPADRPAGRQASGTGSSPTRTPGSNRYRRPATVVIIELDGLDRLVADLGPRRGDRVLPGPRRHAQPECRGADHLARIGPTRFGVLLPETGRGRGGQLRRARPRGLRPVARIRRHRAPPGHRLGESRPGRQPRGRGRAARRSGCSPSCAGTTRLANDVNLDGAPPMPASGARSPA